MRRLAVPGPVDGDCAVVEGELRDDAVEIMARVKSGVEEDDWRPSAIDCIGDISCAS